MTTRTKRQEKIKEILSTRCKYCRSTLIDKESKYTKRFKIYDCRCFACKQKWKIKLKRKT